MLCFARCEVLPHFVNGPEAMGDGVLYLLCQLSVSLVESIGLEDGIPTEIPAASRLNYFSGGLAYE